MSGWSILLLHFLVIGSVTFLSVTLGTLAVYLRYRTRSLQ